MEQPFSHRRNHHQCVSGFIVVLATEAEMPLVLHGGTTALSERHYDAHSNRERDVRAGMSGPNHAYAMAMMGGHPYGNWL